jgi:hypothetical protein
MRVVEKHDSLDNLPSEIKKAVLELRGIRHLSKELPNLPEGKLRDSISDSINSLLQGNSLPSVREFEELQDKVTDLNAENRRLERDLCREDTSLDFDKPRESRFTLAVVCIAIGMIIRSLW